jgi:hypothetical protein
VDRCTPHDNLGSWGMSETIASCNAQRAGATKIRLLPFTTYEEYG